MAIYTKQQVRLVAATDSASYLQKIFERDNATSDEVSRTDLASWQQCTVTVTATKTLTISLFGANAAALSLVRFFYLESTAPVIVSLKIGGTQYVLTLPLAGPAGAGVCKMGPIEMVSAGLQANDTLVLTAGAVAPKVTFILAGDDATET